MDIRSYKTASERRIAVEKALGVALPQIGQSVISDEQVEKKNCENMVGATQVPLGIAGPVTINGEFAKGDFLLPLATTEGALVASISRGCKAIRLSDGAATWVKKTGTTRGPVFFTGSLAKSKELTEWLQTHLEQLQSLTKTTSSHLTLLSLFPKPLADYVFARFAFDTQDAMGMNMVTIATEKLTQFIQQETGVSCLSLAGNFDIDKKPAWLNFIQGRGIEAWAQVTVPKGILSDVLKTTAQQLYDVWLAKNMLGSVMSGSIGFNAHFANCIAAIYLATGQDMAHVVEGSMGVTTVRASENGSLVLSIYLPAVMVGTVGGGTQLPTQKEAFAILQIHESGESMKFAEIVATTVLAGEISLLASLSAGTLASSHQQLGKGAKK